MRLEPRWLAAGAVCALAGCAAQAPGTSVAAGAPSNVEATVVSMERTARSMVGRGRDEVVATLGPATVIRFDSGYEIWVYRFVEPAAPKRMREPAGATASQERATRRDRRPSELVMLFTPSGVVSKVRVRAGDPAP